MIVTEKFRPRLGPMAPETAEVIAILSERIAALESAHDPRVTSFDLTLAVRGAIDALRQVVFGFSEVDYQEHLSAWGFTE